VATTGTSGDNGLVTKWNDHGSALAGQVVTSWQS
jgi:hypothetical protein